MREGKDKKGKPYTQYNVKINGTAYGTFNKKLADEAKLLKGKKVTYAIIKEGRYENLLSVQEFVEVAQEPKPDNAQSPSAMDVDQFTLMIVGMGEKAGMDVEAINTALEGDFSIKSLKDVPVDMQSKVVDYFQNIIDESEAA